MDIKHIVKQRFPRSVSESGFPPELKQALLDRSDRQIFIDKLAAHISEAEAICRKRGKKIKQKTIIETIDDFVKLWGQSLHHAAMQRMKSDAQKALEQQKLDEQQNPEKYLAEMGVKTNDNTQELGSEATASS